MGHEANKDGTIDENTNAFSDFDEINDFQNAVRSLGWGITIKERGNGGYYGCELFFKQQRYNLQIYLKKITSGGRDNRLFEKRIQFSANIDRKGFDAISDNKTIKAILGVYARETYDERIFCGWDIEEWGYNEGRAFNCFIDISTFADAFKFGMAQHKSAKGQTSYAFKPDFLIYYLFNQNELFSGASIAPEFHSESLIAPLQKILYGPPGTGKSTKIKNWISEYGFEVTRTTFHPDSDYHSFVGGYKPVVVKNEKNEKEEITYRFVPQAFTKIYVEALKNPERRYLLVIEEINRGNCAQIFGDIFQCLDRNDAGQSEYEVEADADLAHYLESLELSTRIALPPNLYLYATMNTSDQSLFPMDSAFKRRWDWEYVPIDYAKARELRIEIGEQYYNWGDFIQKANENILTTTESEDKQMGNFFVKPDAPNGTISLAAFKSKVLFYLWSEIYKNYPKATETIFQYKEEDKIEYFGIFVNLVVMSNFASKF
ncbi:MAG: hypothetical protein EAZ32_15535 [Cytophagia bacterium]|nr:MAG: hypothetical protein EAZ32_15535 [Cytophagia bacterium]